MEIIDYKQYFECANILLNILLGKPYSFSTMTTLILKSDRFTLDVSSTQALLRYYVAKIVTRAQNYEFSYLALLCKQTPSYVYLEQQQRSIIMILQLAASFALRFT
uniref:Uncharacterized protein n=1 Tax=Glossina pallidipes TaxID=7398 RepID=A0A1A9ZXE7_GLOPL